MNDADLVSPVRALAVDSAGGAWLGMHGPGLVRVAPDGAMRTWNTSNSGLSSDQIFALHFDRNGMLWIGTWHGGLLRFDTEREHWTHYGTEHGLPDNTVFGILEDDEAHLWLSTYKGLVHFIPCDSPGCKPGTHTFNRHDGLQGDEFDAEAFYRSESGELFFGGENGLNVFRPQDIALNEHEPTLAISSATLNGQRLPGSISDYRPADQARLRGDFGELQIELSALDYNAPQKNLYEYRISGGDWIRLREPVLSLRGLPEGRQVLEFRGSNNDRLWSEQTAQLGIRVLPPLYRHPVVLLFVAALLVLAPFAYFLRRQARLLATRKLLKRKVAERTRELELASSARERFFANISHEIAAPLHLILMMLEQHRPADDKADGGVYRSATGYAAQLLAYLRHLVEGARSLEADSHRYRVNVCTMIDAMVAINGPVALGRGIELVRDDMPGGFVTVFRHSPSSIFSNLLCNALTYTPENGKIRIGGWTDGDVYRFSIENTVHPDHSLDLENVMERGQRGPFDATASGGHGLGLSIVAESVHSLGGKVHRHLSGEGTVVFEVELPLADTSLPPLPDLTGLALTREQQIAVDSIEPVPRQTVKKANTAKSLRVLIVEDDYRVAGLLASALEDQFQVSVAANCREGIALAKSQLPDVVLCDLFLPDQPGFEVLKAVRSNRMTMDALFLMITASVSELDREAGIRLGVDQFIHKPVSARTIRGIIRNHQSLGKQRQQSSRDETLRRRARGGQAAPVERNFKEALAEVLEELYADPSTSIEEIQLRLAMSYPVLIRNCREHLGKTPKRLLVEKRIEKARELLEHSAHKVGVIAELVGFASHAQFATTFKKETGLSPAQYRREAMMD
jgi:signal transduction histidine kinase/DNA-binding response OmpR family regulator